MCQVHYSRTASFGQKRMTAMRQDHRHLSYNIIVCPKIVCVCVFCLITVNENGQTGPTQHVAVLVNDSQHGVTRFVSQCGTSRFCQQDNLLSRVSRMHRNYAHVTTLTHCQAVSMRQTPHSASLSDGSMTVRDKENCSIYELSYKLVGPLTVVNQCAVIELDHSRMIQIEQTATTTTVFANIVSLAGLATIRMDRSQHRKQLQNHPDSDRIANNNNGG